MGGGDLYLGGAQKAGHKKIYKFKAGKQSLMLNTEDIKNYESNIQYSYGNI